MMPGILRMLERVAAEKKIVWEDFLKDLKHKGERGPATFREYLES